MNILRMGCNSIHSEDFKINRPNGYSTYLFLLIKTPAVFFIGGKEQLITKNSAIIYDKNHPHLYSAYNTLYIDDWIQFDTDSSFDKLGIPLNKILPIRNIDYLSDLTQKISSEFYSVNKNREETMALLLKVLFIKLSEIYNSNSVNAIKNINYPKLIKLRQDIYSNPDKNWTIHMMSNQLNICEPYLQKLYKSTFKTSCIADVIKSRIEHAEDLLLKTDFTIITIAFSCGYKNDVHFMRQFKSITGYTPTQYRNHFSS